MSDLDEGIKALLVFHGDGDLDRQGAGWARGKTFREGVIYSNGAESPAEPFRRPYRDRTRNRSGDHIVIAADACLITGDLLAWSMGR